MQTITLNGVDYYLRPLYSGRDGQLSRDMHEGWSLAGFILDPVDLADEDITDKETN